MGNGGSQRGQACLHEKENEVTVATLELGAIGKWRCSDLPIGVKGSEGDQMCETVDENKEVLIESERLLFRVQVVAPSHLIFLSS